MASSETPKSIAVTREDGSVTVSRRTYRSGDFVHVVFSTLTTVMGLLFLWIAIANATLFDDFATSIVILVIVGYGYFGLTRITNSRTVVISEGRITARDGPLPQFVRSVDANALDYRDVAVRSAMRFTFPPIQRYKLWYVGSKGQVDLFRRLPSEEEAKVTQAVVTKAISESRREPDAS